MSLYEQYDVVIRKRNDAYVARVPALGIEAMGANIGEAVNALETVSYPTPRQPAERTPAAGNSDIKRFAIKSGIVTALIVVGGFLLSFQLAAILDNAIYTLQTGFTHTGGSSFWGRITKELDRAAEPNNDLAPEKKAKLISDLHVIAERWRPVIVEVERAFAAPDPANDAASAPPAK